MAAPRSAHTSPWLLERDVAYLNHGSFGACPEPVLEAQRVWRERMESQPVRFLGRELERHLDEARQRVAVFLKADPDGIAFVANATTGVSTVLGSLRFQPGDELLASDHEYNATLNALRAAAVRDGARVVIVRIPFPIRDPSEALEAYLQALTARTRFALVSQVTSPTALVLPVGAIVRELDRRGVDTLVDGAHAPGMVDLDLGALGAATGPATATSGCALRRGQACSTCGPTSGTASTRSSFPTARTTTGRIGRGSVPSSTGREPRTRRRSWRCPRRSGTWAGCMTTAGPAS